LLGRPIGRSGIDDVPPRDRLFAYAKKLGQYYLVAPEHSTGRQVRGSAEIGVVGGEIHARIANELFELPEQTLCCLIDALTQPARIILDVISIIDLHQIRDELLLVGDHLQLAQGAGSRNIRPCDTIDSPRLFFRGIYPREEAGLIKAPGPVFVSRTVD